jgi:NAD(P)-dependent dehydrogenase (short-subunit alcohol dehydrogenase family)
MPSLHGKVALVTGATSGIGRATAVRLAADGARVFAVGRRQDALSSLEAEIGPAVTGVRADVSKLAELDKVYEAIVQNGKGLDVLVANAGGGAFATLEDLTPEEFDRTFATNVRGTVFTVQKSLGHLNNGASVIVVGSTTASRATPAFGAYSASKSAVQQFARVWAVELASRDVRVNTIVPGPTHTPGLVGLASDAAEAAVLLAAEAARVPLGRIAQPAEIAAAIAFLASDEASFITGGELYADGGEARG